MVRGGSNRCVALTEIVRFCVRRRMGFDPASNRVKCGLKSLLEQYRRRFQSMVQGLPFLRHDAPDAQRERVLYRQPTALRVREALARHSPHCGYLCVNEVFPLGTGRYGEEEMARLRTACEAWHRKGGTVSPPRPPTSGGVECRVFQLRNPGPSPLTPDP